MANRFERLSNTLTTTDIKVLSWAVQQAEFWRGSMTGNPDTAPLAAFDKQIKKAKEAIKAAKITKKKYDEAIS